MTPLTDEEQRQIVVALDKLKAAIAAEPEEAIQEAFRAFRQVYRGESRGFVDSFDSVTNRSAWLGQLDIYLAEEIEGRFWARRATTA